MQKLIASLALVAVLVGVSAAQSKRSGADATLGINTDLRQIAVAAALLEAGYKAPATDPSAVALRDEIRKGLAGVDPLLKTKLENFYGAHRRKTADGSLVDEESDALRYRALAFFINPAPSFSIQVANNRIPADLRDLVGFSGLVGELYRTAQFKALQPRLLEAYDTATVQVGKQIGPTVSDIVVYLRTPPVDRIEVPAVRNQEGKIVRPGMTRVRQLRVLIDPILGGQTVAVRGDLLDAETDLAQQLPGDRYAVFAGPLLGSDEAALRIGLFRFMIEPIVDRHRDEIDEARDNIDAVVERSEVAMQRYNQARLSLVTDSLVSALNARYLVREGRLTENGAIALLGDSQALGQVLALHFYDRLKRFEEVGIDLSVFFPEFTRSLDPGREKRRDEEIAAARAAVANEPAPGPSADSAFAADILNADRLVTEKRFSEARPILERVLQAQQTNARALFGLAQVIENSPDPVEIDPNAADEDRAAAQGERLEAAVNLYRKAALNATPRELWLASWSHVYAGRILDFLELREEAVAEYQAAVKVGDVPQGAYKQARDGLEVPYEPQQP